MKVSISIAMCTFNGALYLKEQLDSILHQTTLPDEMIICDDGSTDDTVKILEQFQSHSPFLVKIYKNEALTPLGSTKNFEKSISLCRGDVILLSDQDDVWLPNKVEVLMKEIVNGADIAFSNADLVDGNLRPLNRSLFDSLSLSRNEKHLLKQEKLFEVLIKRNIVTGAAMAFSSKYLNLIMPVSKHWVHDGWIAILIAYHGSFKMIREPLFQYRQHGNNQIGARKMSLYDKVKKVIEDGKTYYPNLISCFEDVKQRLTLVGTGPSYPVFNRLLDQKIIHLKNRVSNFKLSYLAIVLFTWDLFRGSYHKYSRGILSYLRDIVILFSQNKHP